MDLEKKKSFQRELKNLILSEIKRRGSITFCEFMDLCLFHHEYGYYQTKKTRIGKEGDFYTAPYVHPIFGGLIGKQLFQMADIIGGDLFCIVEMGAERGWLANDILNWILKNKPDFYNHLRYYIIELNPNLLVNQKKVLWEHIRREKVFFLKMEDFEKGALRFRGCFISNELVDAFPIHRVIFKNGTLKEIYVTQKNGILFEELGELSDKRINEYFFSLNIQLNEGQIAEVNLKALEWIENISKCLIEGFVITIDYGYLGEELYSFPRYRGTLMCYKNHQVSGNPFESLGEKDITSHVNFTALIRKGEEVGLCFTGIVPQSKFLINLGILEEMDSLQEKLTTVEAINLRLKLKTLIEPEIGMGEVFKVLVQHKGIKKPDLVGLKEF